MVLWIVWLLLTFRLTPKNVFLICFSKFIMNCKSCKEQYALFHATHAMFLKFNSQLHRLDLGFCSLVSLVISALKSSKLCILIMNYTTRSVTEGIWSTKKGPNLTPIYLLQLLITLEKIRLHFSLFIYLWCRWRSVPTSFVDWSNLTMKCDICQLKWMYRNQ